MPSMEWEQQDHFICIQHIQNKFTNFTDPFYVGELSLFLEYFILYHFDYVYIFLSNVYPCHQRGTTSKNFLLLGKRKVCFKIEYIVETEKLPGVYVKVSHILIILFFLSFFSRICCFTYKNIKSSFTSLSQKAILFNFFSFLWEMINEFKGTIKLKFCKTYLFTTYSYNDFFHHVLVPAWDLDPGFKINI